MKICFQNSRGFSLIEIAVVLFILVLLLGSLLVPLALQIEQRQIAETERVLEDTREALIGFAIANGRLPRPATSSTDGTERVATCVSEAECTGFIPWTTLGTSRTDAWGKLLKYSVTPAFANSTFSYTTLTTGSTKTVQTRNSAGTLINLATSVPAVILSHGQRAYGTTESGSTLADSAGLNTDEDTNNAGNFTFVRRVFSDSQTAPGEFDDIVVWIPSFLILNRMASASKLPN